MATKFFIFLFAVLLLSGDILFSQTQSVLNRYGLGNLEYGFSGRKAGMADAGVAIEDDDYLSLQNPASWNLLSSSRFEFGTIFNGLFVKDNIDSRYYSKGYFSGFAFGVPIYSSWGITAVAGIIPYSTINYESKTAVAPSSMGTITVPAHTLIYKGDGGISKIFFGSSYRLKEYFSLGATIDYYFGSLNYRTELDFNSAATNSNFNKTYKAKGLGTTIGLISGSFVNDLFKINNVSDIKAGFSMSLISDLNSDTVLISNSNLFADTNAYGSGKYEMPFRMNLGLSCRLFEKYQLSLDYLYQDWSGYKFNGIADPNLGSVSRISLGGEYRIPADGGAWDRMIYRAGLSYGTSPFVIKGNQVNELGISAGASVALARDNYLDFGVQYLRRGNVTDNFIQEDLIKISIGMSLGEGWFQREEK